MSFNIAHLAFIFAALSGAFGVGFGAFGAHALRGKIEDRLMDTFQTAVQYQMIHALALLIVAILIMQWGRTVTLDFAVYGFIAGILLFSGSLYGLVLTEMRWLGPNTPIGGVCFIIAWLALAVAGFQRIG